MNKLREGFVHADESENHEKPALSKPKIVYSAAAEGRARTGVAGQGGRRGHRLRSTLTSRRRK